jgi:integrase
VTKRARRTGQIIKRGENKHLVRISLGSDPATGKRRYHNHTVRGTRKDAQKYLNATLRDIDLGTFVEPSAQSLNTFLDHWLKSVAKPRVGERTGEDYESILNRYVRGSLGDKRLSHIRPLDIQRCYGELLARGLSARVVRYAHAVLRSALKQAVKWGMLSRNPADLVELPKMTRKEMRHLSQEEAARFQKALTGTPYRSVFIFALVTGTRPEEYTALQWKDVDLKRGTATIQRVLIRHRKGGGWYFAEPKTGKSRRTIPLPASMVRDLTEHRRLQNEARLEAGQHWENNDLVFCTEAGTPLSMHNLTQRHFKPALKRAGLSEEIRLYDLRHSCASLLLAAGENPKVVSERLGHASITLTLDTYSHVLPHLQISASEKLEKMIFEN